MLFDVSYSDPETTQVINDLVGKPFTLRERLRMWTVGSQRFVLKESCDDLAEVLHPGPQRYCNIGLRPRGVQLWCWYKLHTFLLALPFRKLKIAVSNHYLILDSTNIWLKLIPAHNSPLDLNFIDKIQKLSPTCFENYSS